MTEKKNLFDNAKSMIRISWLDMKIPLKSGDMNLYALIGPSPLKIEEKRCKNLQGSKKSFNESSEAY